MEGDYNIEKGIKAAFFVGGLIWAVNAGWVGSMFSELSKRGYPPPHGGREGAQKGAES